MSACSLHVQFVSLLLVIAVVHGVHRVEEVQFKVALVADNTPGGKLFKEKIGEEHVKQLMSSITIGIWEFIFWKSTDDIQFKVQKICLFIRKMTAVSYSSRIADYTYEIHLSAEYMETCEDSMEEEIHMLLTYEIAHILQNTGNGQIPAALKDGIAAYVVLKLSKKSQRIIKFTDGDVWNQTPAVIGQFLDYCGGEYPGFVETLNNKMIFSYRDDYFVELSGKTVDELWKEYKSKKPKPDDTNA